MNKKFYFSNKPPEGPDLFYRVLDYYQFQGELPSYTKKIEEKNGNKLIIPKWPF